MNGLDEFPNRETLEYTKSLLEERVQTLRGLELKYQRLLLPPSEYLSCRRSLLQGMAELESLLQDKGEDNTVGAA